LVNRAEAALDDYDAEKRSPARRTTQRLFVAVFWVLVIIALSLIYALVFR
jgi:hypothetical protein